MLINMGALIATLGVLGYTILQNTTAKKEEHLPQKLGTWDWDE